MDFGPIPPIVRTLKAEKAAQAPSGEWIHTACGTPIRILESKTKEGVPFFGGYCPHCKHFYPLGDEE